MTIRTPICDRFGIDVPIVQTGMGWVAGPLPPISHDDDELAQTLRRERLAAVSAS